jgi:hypothetical protein
MRLFGEHIIYLDLKLRMLDVAKRVIIYIPTRALVQLLECVWWFVCMIANLPNIFNAR